MFLKATYNLRFNHRELTGINSKYYLYTSVV